MWVCENILNLPEIVGIKESHFIYIAWYMYMAIHTFQVTNIKTLMLCDLWAIKEVSCELKKVLGIESKYVGIIIEQSLWNSRKSKNMFRYRAKVTKNSFIIDVMIFIDNFEHVRDYIEFE